MHFPNPINQLRTWYAVRTYMKNANELVLSGPGKLGEKVVRVKDSNNPFIKNALAILRDTIRFEVQTKLHQGQAPGIPNLRNNTHRYDAKLAEAIDTSIKGHLAYTVGFALPNGHNVHKFAIEQYRKRINWADTNNPKFQLAAIYLKLNNGGQIA